MTKILGFSAPLIIAIIIFALNALLPGKWVTGYVTRKYSAGRLRYHINGIRVFFAVVLTWCLLGFLNVIPFDWLYTWRWYGLAGAFAAGLVFSLAVVLAYPPVRKSFMADLYFGRIENLQFRGGLVDVKMWLYLVGATLLELNALSFSAHHLLVYGENASAGIILSTALLTWFIIDYLIFEEVHLYTYDLFAERVGFKLGWGCLVFYPYFYSIFLWATVELPDPQTNGWLLAIFVLVFLGGWSLSRGANLQKYYFKKDPKRAFLGIVPETLTDGSNSLLVNGFWGLSRHINYSGEVLMATGMILCTGYPALIWPWLYPLYYILLLAARQIDDDKRCAAKYGELWGKYREKVPYRIIPHVY